MGLRGGRPARGLQRCAVRTEGPVLPASAAEPNRRGAAHAERHQRADHLPRRLGSGAARHAARRLSPRDHQLLGSRGGTGRPRTIARLSSAGPCAIWIDARGFVVVTRRAGRESAPPAQCPAKTDPSSVWGHFFSAIYQRATWTQELPYRSAEEMAM